MTASVPVDPKPGYLTTEFWTLLFVHLISVVSIIFVFFANHHFAGSEKITSPTVTSITSTTNRLLPLIPVAAFVASGIAQLAYTQARAKTKAAHVAAFGAWVTSESTAVLEAIPSVSMPLIPPPRTTSTTGTAIDAGSTDVGVTVPPVLDVQPPPTSTEPADSPAAPPAPPADALPPSSVVTGTLPNPLVSAG